MTTVLRDASYLDGDGYPTNAAIRRIKRWPANDPTGWLRFCRAIWWPDPDYLWLEMPGDDKLTVRFSTGGWSGNETIVWAMQKNILWTLCWQQSVRGGHYILIVLMGMMADKAAPPDDDDIALQYG